MKKSTQESSGISASFAASPSSALRRTQLLMPPQCLNRSPRNSRSRNSSTALPMRFLRNINRTRESGHNVIFALIAIRALKDHPDLATPSITDGVRKLIARFDNASPGSGYYGKARGRIDGRKITLPNNDGIPPFPDLQTMANAVVDDLIQHVYTATPRGVRRSLACHQSCRRVGRVVASRLS